MHWRLDEYGAERWRWRRLQAKVAGFPARVAASNHRPDGANSHRDAPRLTVDSPVSQSLAAASANTVELGYDESAALSDCAKGKSESALLSYPQAAPPACLLVAHGPRGKVPRYGRLAGERPHLGIMVRECYRLPVEPAPTSCGEAASSLLPSILLLHAPSAPAPLLPSICTSQAVRDSPTTCIYAVSQHLHITLARCPIIGARRLSDRTYVINTIHHG